MRITKGIMIVAVTLLLAAAAQPVLASCGSATLLGTAASSAQADKSYIWTSTGQWTAPGYFPGFAPYAYEPPVTANFAGKWWALGTGDPAPGAGDDSNTWTVDNWFYYYTNGTSYYGGVIFGGWGQAAQIDGCILSNGTGCTCILLSDRVADQSFFALLSGQRDATGNTYYNQPGNDGADNGGPIILQPVPSPQIMNSARVPGNCSVTTATPCTGDGDCPGGETCVNDGPVDLTIMLPAPTQGIYEKDGCDCSSTAQYRVLAAEVPTGGVAPSTRDLAQWTEISTALTDVGAQATVTAACDTAGSVDLYITTQLVFDPASAGGFGVDAVSANSTMIVCGDNPTLAEPNPPRIKPNRPVKPRRGGR